MKIRSVYILLMVVFCLYSPVNIKAQGPFSPAPVTNDPPPPPPDPVDVPLDGGLSILIATGVLYGVKKVRSDKRGKINLQEYKKSE